MTNNANNEKGAWNPTRDEKLKLVNWMFSLQSSDLSALALNRLASAFPTAPEAMLHTAEHHLFVDGKDAALDWIANLAKFLQSQDELPPDYGRDWDLLYHLYNWWQFRALLPEGKPQLLQHIREAREFIEEGSLDAALGSLKAIEESLDGNLDCPQFDT
jgi:hypothetical protein